MDRGALGVCIGGGDLSSEIVGGTEPARSCGNDCSDTGTDMAASLIPPATTRIVQVSTALAHPCFCLHLVLLKDASPVPQ